MTFSQLFLYSRKGCCLCEGLEQRLISIPIDKLNPPIKLKIIDIDHPLIPSATRERYDLQVPLLALEVNKDSVVSLPRVSPRINGDRLFQWLQQACANALGSV